MAISIAQSELRLRLRVHAFWVLNSPAYLLTPRSLRGASSPSGRSPEYLVEAIVESPHEEMKYGARGANLSYIAIPCRSGI